MKDYEYINSVLGTNFASDSEMEKNWAYISINPKLTEELINKYHDKILMGIIDYRSLKNCSIDFFRKYKNELNWMIISLNPILSEEMIEEFKDVLYWQYIVVNTKLSDKLIEYALTRECTSYTVATYQNLSEEFIEKHSKLFLNEVCVYKYHKISNEFIQKHINDFTKEICRCILIYQNISETIQKQLKKKIKGYVPRISNWIRNTSPIKKKIAIEKLGLYECYDDYFIAYKAIRTDRYSLCTLQYKYEKGKTYESWCDCTTTENSFGLNVATEEFAKEYGAHFFDYIIVKCKVKYEDVGRIVHKGRKIRCFKLEVLD